MKSKYDFHLLKVLPKSLVVVRFVELGPLTVVIVVVACLGFCKSVYLGQTLGFCTKGGSWVLEKSVPRADLGFLYQVRTLGF